MTAARALEADVCIVGCGPAGTTLAHELIAAGRTVVIVEAGDAEAPTVDDDLLRGEASGPILKDFRDYLVRSRRSGVGGSGSGWGRVGRPWLMPLTRWDLEPRPWVAGSGWPLPFAELDAYHRRAAAFVGLPHLLPELPFAPGGGQRSDGAPLRTLAYQFPPDAGVLAAHVRALADHESFRVALGTVATTFDAAGGTVERLRAVTRAGTGLTVEAQNFVLAAGGVENPRILLLNAPTRGGQLPDLSPLTGQCFMEHPHVVVGSVQVQRYDDLIPFLPSPGPSEPFRVIGLAPGTQQSEQLLDATVQLTSIEPAEANEPGEPDEARSGRHRLSGPVTCDLFLRAEQQPTAASFVALGTSVDALGRPRPVLRWEPTELDWASVVGTAEVVADVLGGEPGWSARITVDRQRPWPAPPADTSMSTHPTWGHHHMGTTRMARTPETGAVDAASCVFGTTNLYVAGSSTFPTGGAANPTFTIIALALRLADHLTGAAGTAGTAGISPPRARGHRP
jgi:choline dehydrogenase-like flavoprotein